MPKDYPDHHDAELVLRLYDLRREALLRDSRTAMNMWMPKSFDDVVAVTKPDHPHNAAFRQVTGYWEMVFGMARHGVIHPDFLMENSGEGLFFFARMEPFVEQLREMTSPRACMNAEWVSKETETGRALMVSFRARLEKMRAAAS